MHAVFEWDRTTRRMGRIFARATNVHHAVAIAKDLARERAGEGFDEFALEIYWDGGIGFVHVDHPDVRLGAIVRILEPGDA